MTKQQHQSVLVVGVPEHLTQYDDEVKSEQPLYNALTELKKNHIIVSQLGKVRHTSIHINNELQPIVTIGLGNINQLNQKDYLKIWGNLFQYLKNEPISHIRLKQNTFLAKSVDAEIIYKLMGLQSEQSIYQFDHYRSDKKAPFKLEIIFDNQKPNSVEKLFQKGKILGRAINHARDLGNTPPNIMTPQYLAESTSSYFSSTSVTVNIKDEKELQQEGFGLIHAVGKGSIHPPRLITLEYHGDPEHESDMIALVGKGITYDSGGYSIKSKTGMPSMKYDMCGAANVIGIVDAVQALGLKMNIVAVIAAAENMIANNAMKPDDVFTALSGDTVEVPNTDAEGRLVLGDATFYANQYQPQLIMDFATLTGAAIVALGEDKAAVFNKNVEQQTLSSILQVAQSADEPVFELPITDTERQSIKSSEVADLTNHVNAQGRALFAAAFVTHFSGSTPHLHFDIAGPATSQKQTYKGPKGATGYMITTIVEWLTQKSQF
ncbi:leucyl aminopeptidase family protein [Staphylococcus felis]|uniref:Probable cytosol aminopeptidase n=1 Tax=Staphylococcus felis TaxID=46127 RepID=A0AAX1RUR7_9STAP|nr:leucyl aminopeptidase family protein [Staphylococcus felis]MBH9582052.1 leucyl aminopeptidase family protein [Staphylococcus felis]MDM8328109.1 leucyl aminopeptidase family protein [Staphylococcus felis]MDQ7193688.1 leucyl aminopeptidase family protein [Staphylococcus felis]REH80373.1 leucyl aminopeptidase family protein [Staphylococcus felis]REH80997.1 leucyl aminopeptidase family protein [Staphylococcus felis]